MLVSSEKRINLGEIIIPNALPPIIDRIFNDWRDLHAQCKTRRLSIHVLEEEHSRLRSLTDSFFVAFRNDPIVEFNQETYRVKSSVILHGNHSKLLYPFDLYIGESHANILLRVLKQLPVYPSLDNPKKIIDFIAQELEAFMNVTYYNQSQATKITIVHELSQSYDIIHFAGHTQYGKQPGIWLADGILTPGEIVHHLEGNPIVFINACSSAKERIEGFDQAPDFIIPDEWNPQIVIEAKITEDDGTARDKVTRIQHLAEISNQHQLRGQTSFEVIACIDGRGFGVRREDMRKLLAATKGKVFTLKMLDQLIAGTDLHRFKSRG